MNSKILNTSIISVITAVAVSFLVYIFISNLHIASGSVTFGNDYYSTTTVSTSASATAVWYATSTSNSNGFAASLGSVIISSSSPALTNINKVGITLYDATSTMATSTARTLAQFPVATASGTYTFDVQTRYGLVVETPPGFNGVYTITYR